MSETTPLTPQIVRALSDKIYEKRKAAALDIEKIVRDHLTNKETNKIEEILETLIQDFTYSVNNNSKKGGLIALAAAAIALGPESNQYLSKIFPPVLSCFQDPDPKIRYYACESLYNMCKVMGGAILTEFNSIFDALIKLIADQDQSVKSATELLDRLIKDIVTDNKSKFDVEKFIPILNEKIYAKHSSVRQFIVSWISLLDNVPDIDLVVYLPAFLDGLFTFLSDPAKDINTQTSNTLSQFLEEIKKSDAVDYQKIAEILIRHIYSKSAETQQTALTWVNEFIGLSKDSMLQYTAKYLGAILPCISSKNSAIKAIANDADLNLMNIVIETESEIDYEGTVATVTILVGDEQEETRKAAIEWLIVLHKKAPLRAFKLDGEVFPVLLKTLSDKNDDVVRSDLELLAQICTESDETYFRQFLENLIKLFSTDRELLQNRGSLIIRQLCLALDPEKIYTMLSEILEQEEDLSFSGLMVSNLNLILMTTAELADLRKLLKNFWKDEKARQLFQSLYRSWSHNGMSTFSLCLLAQVYEHACKLVEVFTELEVTVSFLVDVDKFVQLLESPNFAYLRLQLLEAENINYLFKCLYGILMILPQSGAFATLRNRLNSVSSMGVLHLTPDNKSSQESVSKIGSLDFNDLIRHFRSIQEKHQIARKMALRQTNTNKRRDKAMSRRKSREDNFRQTLN